MKDLTEQERIEKQFTMFIHMFNLINDTTYNVDSALEDKRITDLFIEQRGNLIKKHSENDIKLLSTKRESYYKLNVDTVDYKIYNMIRNNPNITRSEICQYISMKIQTVSGGVTRLLKNGMIQRSGHIYDHETKRNVETLCIR